MEERKEHDVSMRVKIGDYELEVSGPESFVEKKIKDFIKEFKEDEKKRIAKKSTDSGDLVTKRDIGEDKLSQAQFFRKIKAKTDVDKVLGAGFYLEKYNSEEKFTATGVKDIINLAKKPAPKNANDSINNNIKKGYIMAAGDKDGKKAFVLTTDGEDFIVDMLNMDK